MPTATNISELKRRAERRVVLLMQIGDLQEDLKTLKGEDKADGYNEKALAQCVKELLNGSEYQAEQLQFELELDSYRTAVGLPVTLETAQRHICQGLYKDKMDAAAAEFDHALGVSVTLSSAADTPQKSTKKQKETATA
jgi:uncharacterized protein (UPF0335 family)